MPSVRGPLALVAPALLVETVHAIPTTHCDQFFPFWNEPCGRQTDRQTGCFKKSSIRISQQNTTNTRQATGRRPQGATLSLLISPVIICIFVTLSEHRKAELGASTFSLGLLLPTILQSLGSTPPETALLSLRRPLLAMLLALGSPSVTAMKTSKLIASFKDLVEKRPTTISAFRWNYVTKRWRVALSTAEYVVAIASAANVVYLAYQLGFHAIVIFAPETIFMLPLWTFICIIVIHFGDVFIQHLKLHIDHKETSNATIIIILCLRKKSPNLTFLRRITTAFREDVIPTAFQRHKTLQWRKETILINFLIWLLSMGTLANFVFGSMSFCSLFFFSVQDVLLIVALYFINALVCRGIVRLDCQALRSAPSLDNTRDPTTSRPLWITWSHYRSRRCTGIPKER
ncbi:hypothetical protein PspLS_09454 [Pyricularia sp. CBS 133598]|nr:hypothetical protein PspLS_09454 [Pyricularia sp. CBS 133598]